MKPNRQDHPGPQTELPPGEFERRVLSSLPIGLFVCDPSLRVTSWNLAMEAITGLAESQVVGRGPEVLATFSPEAGLRRLIVCALAGKRVGPTDVPYQVTSSGRSGLMRIECGPVCNGQGQATGVVVLVRETGASKTSEEAVNDLRLRQAQRMEALGCLAGGVAHDFNNQLQVILGNAELACEDIPPDHVAREPVEEVRKAGRRATELVQQLLAFSRRDVMRMRAVNINELVTGLMKMIRRLIGEHIVCETQLAPDLRTALADAGQIEQALVNLCLNARDAMPKGGRLILRTENTVLDGSFCDGHPGAEPGEYVTIAVRDTGVGFPPEALEHLFEPFYTTKSAGHGTGLGLATVYTTVNRHRGIITLETKADAGTTFHIHLRCGAAKPARVASRPAYRPPAGGGRTLLVAEDEPAVREFTRQVLERGGYQILMAADGEEAVQLFHEHAASIDLVLLDHAMPRKNGHDAAQAIRGLRAEVPILFFSANDEPSMSDENAGEMTIRKPIAPNDLLEVVHTRLTLRPVPMASAQGA